MSCAVAVFGYSKNGAKKKKEKSTFDYLKGFDEIFNG